MCGKAYDPRLIYAWPSATLAVMGGAQAAKTLLQIQVSSMKKKGLEVSEEEKNELLKEITDRYTAQTSPYWAASRLIVDGIIDPRETRNIISKGIEMANLNPDVPEYRVGVIQT